MSYSDHLGPVIKQTPGSGRHNAVHVRHREHGPYVGQDTLRELGHDVVNAGRHIGGILLRGLEALDHGRERIQTSTARVLGQLAGPAPVAEIIDLDAARSARLVETLDQPAPLELDPPARTRPGLEAYKDEILKSLGGI